MTDASFGADLVQRILIERSLRPLLHILDTAPELITADVIRALADVPINAGRRNPATDKDKAHRRRFVAAARAGCRARGVKGEGREAVALDVLKDFATLPSGTTYFENAAWHDFDKGVR